jgi:hypothetical protein
MSNLSEHSSLEPTQRPGRYCTRCGTFNLRYHSYCDHCGLPLTLPDVTQGLGACGNSSVNPEFSAQHEPDSPTSTLVPKHIQWLAPGAALCCLLVAALAGVVWHEAHPPPNPREVTAALRLVGARAIKPSPDLLCLKNLPYYRDYIRIQPTDVNARNWLETLVSVGLYAPGLEVVPDQISGSTFLQYQTLPALNHWRRDGKLCVAQGWELDSVRDNSIQKAPETDRKRYMATIVWRAHTLAPWLAQLPSVDLRMISVNVDAKGLTTTTRQALERVNGRWLAVNH